MTPIDPRVNPALVPEKSKAVVIAKDQADKYVPVPSIITPDHKVITRWELSYDERQALIRGEDVFLTIWGTPIRPVLLTVGPVDWKEL